MSVYTMRVWHNGDAEAGETGAADEYELADNPRDIAPSDEAVERETVQLRLLETLNINLVAIAESLDGINRQLRYVGNAIRKMDR